MNSIFEIGGLCFKYPQVSNMTQLYFEEISLKFDWNEETFEPFSKTLRVDWANKLFLIWSIKSTKHLITESK